MNNRYATQSLKSVEVCVFVCNFYIQYETERVERLLMRERQIVHNGAWIISMSDRVLTLVEFVCWSVSLSSERDRQTEKQFESAI
jgi:hypothetical protein